MAMDSLPISSSPRTITGAWWFRLVVRMILALLTL